MTLCAFAPLNGQVQFMEAAASWGLSPAHAEGIYGDGISFYDFDQDGWDDLTIGTDAGAPLEFYRNLGGAGFQRILPAPVVHLGEVKQVLWADYDNDGDPDLFVSDYVGTDRLYRNEGGLNMVDVTVSAGLPDPSPAFSFGADWGDYDRDGWLDLYVSHRSSTYPDGINLLYRNMGGFFQDVTAVVGVEDSAKLTFCSSFLDYEHDGWPDIYEANDKQGFNTMLKNTGAGGFVNTSFPSGGAVQIQAMCVAVADYDMDGDQDIYVTNDPSGNVLLRNEGDGTFSDQAAACGVAFYSVGWGSNWFDAELDGDLDLYVSGSLAGSGPNLSAAFYENGGDGTFSLPVGIGMTADTTESYVNAFADVNGDGFPDIGVHNAAPYSFQLWLNQSASDNHWLKLDLVGTTSNREAIGCWVEAWTDGARRVRYTHAAQGYLAQNSRYLMFGLGAHEVVDSLIVEWPSGHVDRFYELCIDRMVRIEEGMSIPEPFWGLNTVSYCEDGSIEIDAGDFLSYSWSNGETSSVITVDSAGTYSVTVEHESGLCLSANLLVEEMPAPEITGFASTPDNLTGTGTATVGVTGGTPPYIYQWDDPALQTGQTAVGLWTGSYGVTITDANGCETQGTVMVDISTAILEAENGWSLYPLPADEFVEVRRSAPGSEALVFLYDLSGRLLQSLQMQAAELSVKVDRGSLPSGVYRIHIREDRQHFSRPVLLR